MEHIVQRDGDQLFTTSEIIANRAEVEHRSVLQIIGKYEDDLAAFGPTAFEMRSQTRGGHPIRIAKLNEQQSTLVLTYLRNTETVRKFKMDLVKAFYEMAQQLRQPLSEDQIVAQALQITSARVQALEAKVEEIEPKAEAYDTFIGSDGTYSVGNVAKMLGTSQNKLFTELRNHGVFIGKGHMRNTPYQQYMHHFAVKAYSYTRSDGNEGTSYTTRVQPSGVDFIRKKLKLEEVAA